MLVRHVIAELLGISQSALTHDLVSVQLCTYAILLTVNEDTHEVQAINEVEHVMRPLSVDYIPFFW